MAWGKAVSYFFVIPLLLGLLAIAGGVYAVHRGEKLKEGEKVGGWGTYVDRTGFIWRGTLAIVFGGMMIMVALLYALAGM
jgi:hypothetical protein